MQPIPYPGGPVSSSTQGLLLEQRVLVLLMERLQHFLDRQAEAWDPVDAALYERLGQSRRAVQLEMPDPINFHRGYKPSLIKLPAHRFPALAVAVDLARPLPESRQRDTTNVYAVPIYVEYFGISQEFQQDDEEQAVLEEGVLGDQVWRFAEAIVQLVLSDPSLGGIAVGMTDAPSITRGEPWSVGGDPKERHLRRIYQGVRVDLPFRAYAVVPDVTPLPNVLPLAAV